MTRLVLVTDHQLRKRLRKYTSANPKEGLTQEEHAEMLHWAADEGRCVGGCLAGLLRHAARLQPAPQPGSQPGLQPLLRCPGPIADFLRATTRISPAVGSFLTYEAVLRGAGGRSMLERWAFAETLSASALGEIEHNLCGLVPMIQGDWATMRPLVAPILVSSPAPATAMPPFWSSRLTPACGPCVQVALQSIGDLLCAGSELADRVATDQQEGGYTYAPM